MKKSALLLQTLGVALMIALFSACSGAGEHGKSNAANAGNDKDSLSSTALPAALTAVALDKAKADGKPIFLVITGTGATGIDEASIMVNEATLKTKNATAFSLNRDHAASADIVAKFGIATVPLPFILVVSAKGLPVAGGQPAQLTTDQMVKSLPSPKQDEVYAALSDKKSVFIVVSQKDFTDKKEILTSCQTACSRIEGSTVIVEVDFDDPVEKAFLSQIGVKAMNGATITVVSNAAGQITETFTKKPTINQLIQAATKVIKKSGCAPGGCATPC